MRWDGEEHLRVGNTNFIVTTDPSTWDEAESRSDQFVLLKNRRLIETLLRLAPKRVENVLDLGIFKGGSVALYSELFSPKRLVGIELDCNRVDALDQFISRHSLGEQIRLHYGINQNDLGLLAAILQENFGDDPLDMVVDDCSHMYEPTKRSLNMLLPRLRPGGLYVIEDWGWAHWPAERWQGSQHQFVDEETPLSQLILELVMVAASRPDLIRELTIWHSAVYITTGDEVISDGGFDISKSYLTDGRRILCEHPPR